LKEDLHAASIDDRLELRAKLIAREHVAFGVTDGAIERAEAAARRAHVGVVDVAIDDVRDDVVRVLAAADGVGREAEIEEAGVREEALAFGRADAFAVGGARERLVERRARAARGGRRVVVEEADARLREQAGARGVVEEALEAAAF